MHASPVSCSRAPERRNGYRIQGTPRVCGVPLLQRSAETSGVDVLAHLLLLRKILHVALPSFFHVAELLPPLQWGGVSVPAILRVGLFVCDVPRVGDGPFVGICHYGSEPSGTNGVVPCFYALHERCDGHCLPLRCAYEPRPHWGVYGGGGGAECGESIDCCHCCVCVVTLLYAADKARAPLWRACPVGCTPRVCGVPCGCVIGALGAHLTYSGHTSCPLRGVGAGVHVPRWRQRCRAHACACLVRAAAHGVDRRGFSSSCDSPAAAKLLGACLPRIAAGRGELRK